MTPLEIAGLLLALIAVAVGVWLRMTDEPEAPAFPDPIDAGNPDNDYKEAS